jgi:hypothetical protein
MADEIEIDDTPGGEYPKMLYKGSAVDPNGYDVSELETVTVANSTAEKAARADGYADLREVAKPAKSAKAS